MMIFISSILLTVIILLPIGRKFEISFKNIFILALIVGILTAIATALITQLLTLNSTCPPFFGRELLTLVIELCFLFLFTAIIGLYRFYRDPERKPPDRGDVIISPADGFIRYIKQLKDGSWNIAITMTYLDVHIIRSPVDGKIASIKKIGDKFLSLKNLSALEMNRQVHILINNDRIPQIELILTASRVVRKILLWVEEKQEIKKGSRLGKIVWGSQCDIIIPSLNGLKVAVQEKQQVYAGLTVLVLNTETSEVASNLSKLKA